MSAEVDIDTGHQRSLAGLIGGLFGGSAYGEDTERPLPERDATGLYPAAAASAAGTVSAGSASGP